MNDGIRAQLLHRIDQFQGYVWRGHNRRYDARDDGGSRHSTGRFHRGPNLFTPAECWPALYTSIELETSLGEIMRSRPSSHPKDVRFTEILVELSAVADCRDLASYGIDRDRLFDDWDYATGHALALAVRDSGAEAMLIPSASRLGDNLVVFPDLLRPGSTLSPIRSVDPDLTKAGGWSI